MTRWGIAESPKRFTPCTSVTPRVHSAAQPGTPNDAQARPRRRVGAGGHLTLRHHRTGMRGQASTEWAGPTSAEVVHRLPLDREPVRPKPVDAAPSDSLSYLSEGDQLLAAAAHELRLPLSHIKGFVSTLRRSDVEWDEPTRRDFLAEIETETDRLTQLVEKLLATSSPRRAGTAARAAERTPSNPAALVQGGLHRVRGLLRDHTVRVEMPAWLPSVRVDVDAIERVV